MGDKKASKNIKNITGTTQRTKKRIFCLDYTVLINDCKALLVLVLLVPPESA